MAVPLHRLVQGDGRAAVVAVRSGCPAVRGLGAREAFEHVEVTAGDPARVRDTDLGPLLAVPAQRLVEQGASGSDDSKGADGPAVPGRGAADGAERAGAVRPGPAWVRRGDQGPGRVIPVQRLVLDPLRADGAGVGPVFPDCPAAVW